MPTVWASSDLHLSTAGTKPMDIFGDHWEAHDTQMATAWDAVVGPDDIVLTPGDFSWAMRAADAVSDFAWLAARPGHKILVKGNHDYWWPDSKTKMAALLPANTHALKKTSVSIHGIGFFGVRGGDFTPLKRYGDERSTEDIETWLAREEHELRLSLAHLDAADAAAGRRRGLRVCLFHYPPIAPGRKSSRFSPIIEEAGATWCIYGHLHGKNLGPAKVEGVLNGVDYRCTSCDQVGFAPLRLFEIP
jgi:predicted phosphohydrolase